MDVTLAENADDLIKLVQHLLAYTKRGFFLGVDHDILCLVIDRFEQEMDRFPIPQREPGRVSNFRQELVFIARHDA
jgi:hypothetical protein